METSRTDRELTLIRHDMDELVKIAQWLLRDIEQTITNELLPKRFGRFVPPNDPKPIEPSGMCLKQDFWPHAIKNPNGELDRSIIAVDFDGTLCENAWPGIGAPIMPMIEYIKHRAANGAKLILWTNRTGEALLTALDWCESMDIYFDAVNENLQEIIEKFGGDCRKIYADEYIDDRAHNARTVMNWWKEAKHD